MELPAGGDTMGAMAGVEQPQSRLRQGTGLSAAVLLLGSVVAGLGIAALFGWALGFPRGARFMADGIPMAPSTAVFFVVHGVALAVRARSRNGRIARLTFGLVGIATAAAVVLFVLSSLGIRSPVEHLGMTITGELRGAPLGYISPVTAACFALSGSSSLLSLARKT